MPDPADRFRPLFERWGALWGVPDLATRGYPESWR